MTGLEPAAGRHNQGRAKVFVPRSGHDSGFMDGGRTELDMTGSERAAVSRPLDCLRPSPRLDRASPTQSPKPAMLGNMQT